MTSVPNGLSYLFGDGGCKWKNCENDKHFKKLKKKRKKRKKSTLIFLFLTTFLIGETSDPPPFGTPVYCCCLCYYCDIGNIVNDSEGMWSPRRGYVAVRVDLELFESHKEIGVC